MIRQMIYRKLYRMIAGPHIKGDVEIGPGTYVNGFTHIIAGPNSRIRIGGDGAISFNVHIRALTHDPEDISQMIEADISIGYGVWIGANSVIREGVTIGDHAIIGANSVVTHNVSAYEIVGGTPARHIRFKEGAPK